MFCENCGAQIDEGAKFCEDCGIPVVGSYMPQQSYSAPIQPSVIQRGEAVQNQELRRKTVAQFKCVAGPGAPILSP